MITLEELTDQTWYRGNGRGARIARWFADSGLFVSLRYHWWGGREWPELNTGIHYHYQQGGDFRPNHEVTIKPGERIPKKSIDPLAYYHNGSKVGRWFPDENGGHFKVSEWSGHYPVTKEYSYEAFAPVEIIHQPEELSFSAQQKINEKGL